MTEVTVQREGAVAVVTLNAPARRNALTLAMAEELGAACDQIDGDQTIGAAVIRGAGGSFCSGAALEALTRISEDPAEDDRYRTLGAIYDAFLRVGDCRVPTVAAIRGAAVGAGLNLALITDLRVVADDAKLIAGFLRIGVHPGGGSLTLLERLVGREAAAAVALFGEPLSGRRAQELGAAWEAVGDGDVEARAIELAARAAADPELTRRTIRSWRGETATRLPVSVAVEYERAAQMWSLRRRGSGGTP